VGGRFGAPHEGMTCPQCQHDNRAAAKFCENCGAGLPRLCAGCGTALRPAAKFCDECGQAVTAAPASAPDRAVVSAPVGYTPKHLADKILTSRSAVEGERKQVTVVFVDCVGFTALSSTLDPEELHGMMDGCFQHLLDAVHRYEGTVNQFTGDGIMALFGAPIAHEDHAVRGVAAALAMQHAVRGYADTLRAQRGIELAVRIGLNTGPVVVGKIGDDLRMDYTAQGETVNLAARLQQAAEPGGILISEATMRLAGGYFVLHEAGELTLKGLPAPVRTFGVTGQRRRRARFDLSIERGLTPLVGRRRELASLSEALDRAVAGRGNIVSVVGAAGIGKSRLVYELRRGLDEQAVTFLEGRCQPHEAQPFDLIVQLLQANFGLEDGEPERAQVQKIESIVRRLDPTLEWTIPYLKHLLALPASELDVDGLDDVQRKRRMVDAVRALTLRGAEHRPLFLLMEDLQWIDRSSGDYLDAVVDSLVARPIVLVCTYRPGYVPGWADRSFHERLVLEPFSDEVTAVMVRTIPDGGFISASTRQLIVRRAEGNPLFVEELTAYLRDRGLLNADAATALSEAEVPSTIQDVLTARIDRLPDSSKRTLQVASVLGREFPRPLLEAIAPPGLELEAELAALVRTELLVETTLFPDARYRFTHLLVQQVAYQSLLVKARAELHARSGRALERLYAGRPEEILPDLAHHYARSPERDKALEYLVRAGDRVRSLFAYDEAAAYYRDALRSLDGAAGDDRRPMILEKLGDTAYAHGELAAALGHWAEALALVEERGERRRGAELHRKMGVAAWDTGDRAVALEHLECGRGALGDDVHNAEAARLYHELGRIHFRLGDHAQATEWARRALALGQELGAPDVVANAYNTLGVAVARAGNIEEAATYVQQSLDAALAHQLGAVACRAYSNLAVMYAAIDHVRSSEYCREGLALAQRIGDQLQQAWLFCTLAGGHCTLAGDYDEGIKAAERAVEVDRRLGQRGHLPVPLIILAQIHQCRGDHEQSARYYREALEVASAVGEPQLLFPCYDGLATLAIEEGNDAEAEAWLTKSRDVQQATGWTSETFLVLPFLC
jgi:adenylate cyclase